jgi:hypothetical protein
LRRVSFTLARSAACAWLVSGCVAPGHGGSPTVPVDDDAYDRARRLDAAGLVQSAVIGSRTLGRKEIARSIVEAQSNLALLGPGLGESFDHLYEAYLPEILADAAGLDYLGPQSSLRMDTLDVSFIFSEGAVKPPDPAAGGHVPQDDASGFNYYGRVDTGPGVRLTPRAYWRLGRRALVTLRPEFTGMTDNAPEKEVSLLEANVRLFSGSWEIEFGRDSLWWGPGRHGSLLLSNNAPPFSYMWKLGTHEPVLLPGMLNRWLGPTSFTVFGARLDDRPGSSPWLGGMRLEFRVRPNWTFALSRTAIMGGEVSGLVDTSLLWDVFIGKDENLPEGPGDQKAGGELRYRNADLWQPFEVYAEIQGEDQANFKPSRTAFLAGLYLPRFGRSGLLGTQFDFLVEYASTYVAGQPDYWYTHYQFDFDRDGRTFPAYTYNGFWMGHHMGTNADDVYVKLGFTPGRGARPDRAGGKRLEAAFDRERHHVSRPTAEIETKDEWTFRFLWEYRTMRTLSVATRFQEWRNFGDTPGEVERTSWVECRLTYRF